MNGQVLSIELDQDQPAAPLSLTTWQSTYEYPEFSRSPKDMHPQSTHRTNLSPIPANQQNLAQHHLFVEKWLSSNPEPATSLPPFSPFSQLVQPQLHYPPYHAPEHAYCQALNNGMQQSYLRHINEIHALRTTLHMHVSMYTQVLEHLTDHSALTATETQIDDALGEYADDILSRSSLSEMMQMSDSLLLRNELVLLLQRIKRGWREKVDGDGRCVEELEKVREEVKRVLGEEGWGEE